jgi:hypothetical protein
MSFKCNFSEDIPDKSKQKRIIFYQQGFKIYGLLPYILNRKLKGEFYSNHFTHDSGAFRGMGVIAPAYELNYTVVPYSQDSVKAKLLIDWLLDGSGFEWAIALDFHADIKQGTAFTNKNPDIWAPGKHDGGWSDGFPVAMKGLLETELQKLLIGDTDVG